jgi:hypothetical protein
MVWQKIEGMICFDGTGSREEGIKGRRDQGRRKERQGEFWESSPVKLYMSKCVCRSTHET